MSTVDKQKLEVIKSYVNAYNSFDVEGMLKSLSPNVIFKNSTNEIVDLVTNGIDEFKVQAEKATSYFSNREQKIINTIQENGIITIDIDYTGTLAIDLPNGLKEGSILEMQGKSIFRFEGLQIIEINDFS
ncbi:nuclear transport factor 2 family protein [uncultured Dokdonia sp.]|uniref:nuclear transport factor 2 family protein n=1 Tax=uncultured Dokdonia sp. TaxID=575653 RepID=UPI00260D97AA|nr:nuclear transport factor 2 family protein [uncultured Dokdonia sp.]